MPSHVGAFCRCAMHATHPRANAQVLHIHLSIASCRFLQHQSTLALTCAEHHPAPAAASDSPSSTARSSAAARMLVLLRVDCSNRSLSRARHASRRRRTGYGYNPRIIATNSPYSIVPLPSWSTWSMISSISLGSTPSAGSDSALNSSCRVITPSPFSSNLENAWWIVDRWGAVQWVCMVAHRAFNHTAHRQLFARQFHTSSPDASSPPNAFSISPSRPRHCHTQTHLLEQLLALQL